MKATRLKHSFPIIMLSLLLSMSCSNKIGAQATNPDKSSTVTTFKNGIAKLWFGQTVSLDEKDMSLMFVKVTNDSRCPKGGECIQQGNVYIELKLEKNGKLVESFILSDLTTKSMKEIGNIIIKLNSVSPYPTINKTIEAQNYVLVLEKSKKIKQGNL